MSARTKRINALVQRTRLYTNLSAYDRKALVAMVTEAYRMGHDAGQREAEKAVAA